MAVDVLPAALRGSERVRPEDQGSGPRGPVQNRRVRPARRRPRVRRPVAVPAQGETPRDSCVWGPQLRCRLSEGGVVVPRVRVQKQHCSESGTRFSPAGSPSSQACGSEVPMACSVLMP